MYEFFYGFREKPFHVTADPSFLYLSTDHQEAMAHLVYGIQQRLGFLLITGEVGTGKTTLAKTLVETLPPLTKTSLLLNPTLNGPQLLQAILRDFGLPAARSGAARGELLQTLQQFLIRQGKEQAFVVLIIDEAQGLSSNALEQVRLLSNIETPKTKLLQIILLGQPELGRRLSKEAALRALNERIAVRYEIRPLDPQEVTAYIGHRLEVARAERPPHFTQEALALIAEASRGVPRRINHLCDQALLAGFVRESRVIDVSLLQEAMGAAGRPAAPIAFIKEIPLRDSCTQGG